MLRPSLAQHRLPSAIFLAGVALFTTASLHHGPAWARRGVETCARDFVAAARRTLSQPRVLGGGAAALAGAGACAAGAAAFTRGEVAVAAPLIGSGLPLFTSGVEALRNRGYRAKDGLAGCVATLCGGLLGGAAGLIPDILPPTLGLGQGYNAAIQSIPGMPRLPLAVDASSPGIEAAATFVPGVLTAAAKKWTRIFESR